MNKTKGVLLTVAIVAAVALLFTFMIQGVQNKAISYEEQIDTARAEVTVQEKRRNDLWKSMAECIMAYDQHEAEIMLAIAESHENSDVASEQLQTIVNAVAEAYPELKSGENYKELMKEMAVTENLISESRKSYNNWVKRYNQYTRKFPNAGILEMLGYIPNEYEQINYGNKYEDAPTNLFGD